MNMKRSREAELEEKDFLNEGSGSYKNVYRGLRF